MQRVCCYYPEMDVKTYCPEYRCAKLVPCAEHDNERPVTWWAKQFKDRTDEMLIRIKNALELPAVMLLVIMNYLGLGMFRMDRLSRELRFNHAFPHLCAREDGGSFTVLMCSIFLSPSFDMHVFLDRPEMVSQTSIKRFRVPAGRLWAWVSGEKRSPIPRPFERRQREPDKWAEKLIRIQVEEDAKGYLDICREALVILRAIIEWRDVALHDLPTSG